MKLTVLGSGTVDPQPLRSSSGYHLATSEGDFLFDLGNGALRRAVEFELEPNRVGRLFLSHLHPDHTADLVPFLFARNYAPPPWNECVPLTIHGPVGTEAMIEALYNAWPSIAPKEGKAQVDVSEYDEGCVFQREQVKVEAVSVEHGDMIAHAFRVTDGTRVLAYSGDTKLCAGARTVAREADLFICECSCFPRGCEPLYCREVHLSWEDVAEICREAQPKRLLLTHLYEPVLASKPNPLDSLREELDIPVDLAEDGYSLRI